MSQTISDRVRSIIASQLQVREEQLHEDVNLVDDLGVDSLAAVELILAVEQEFDIDVPDSESEQLRTVREMISYVGRQIGGQ